MKNFTFSAMAFAVVALLSGFYSAKATAQSCNDFQYLYMDDTGEIYSGEISGTNFVLSSLFDPGMLGDLAINQNSKEIYVIDAHGANIKTFDQTGALIRDVALSGLNSTYAIVWNKADDKLYVGNINSQKVYTLDPVTGAKTLFADNMPLEGGDLISTEAGELLLVKRGHGTLSKVYDITSGTAVFMYDVVQEVCGAANTPSGDYIMAEGGSTLNFHIYNPAGVSQSVLTPVDVNGDPFPVLGTGGDMASVCLNNNPGVECSNFDYYYIADNTPGVSQGTVYKGKIVGGDFVLTSFFNAGMRGHIALNTINGDIYVIHSNGNRLKTFDASGNLINDVSTSLPNTPALVWNPATGMLYTATPSGGKVYEIDPVSGNHTLFASGLPVRGGDLLINNAGELLLVERSTSNPSKLYNITSGSAVFIANVGNEANGAALTSTDGIITAQGNSNNFHLFDGAGAPITTLNAVDNLGNPFPVRDGDMASGCMGNNAVVEGCDSYSMFYTDYLNQSSADVFRLDINPDNSLNKTLLTHLDFSSTSGALSSDGKLYICNRYGAGYYIVWDVIGNSQIGGNIPMTDESGNNIQDAAGSVIHDGMLYVISKDENIYALNPATGEAIETYAGLPGRISDILFDFSGDMWVMDRDNSMFHNLTTGDFFSIPLNDVDGIALLPNGNFAAAEGGNASLIYEVDPVAEALTGVTYETNISIQWGDLTGGCMSDNPDVIPGQCNATEVVNYTQGLTKTDGALQTERTDASNALGTPERTDDLNYVSLGYGGSLTLAFDGAVPNEDGDDIEIVETTFNFSSVANYPEYADVYVSVDGINWSIAGTVDHEDRFIDISDAGAFDDIYFVKIVNSDLSSTTDGFDVDGVVALHNCEDADFKHTTLQAQATFTVYPNPTSGSTTIEFIPVEEGTSTIQIIDMSGRVVETIFNQDVNADQPYRINFDGSDLPNGVYIAKITTNNEVSIGKIMIAR